MSSCHPKAARGRRPRGDKSQSAPVRNDGPGRQNKLCRRRRVADGIRRPDRTDGYTGTEEKQITQIAAVTGGKSDLQVNRRRRSRRGGSGRLDGRTAPGGRTPGRWQSMRHYTAAVTPGGLCSTGSTATGDNRRGRTGLMKVSRAHSSHRSGGSVVSGRATAM